MKAWDAQEMWEQAMGWNQPISSTRKWVDEIELDFWKKLAPTFDKRNNLHRVAGHLATVLKEIIGEDKCILEVGCGTGIYTCLMASYNRLVWGVDLSPDMIAELQKKIQEKGIKNIRTIVSKWEDFDPKDVPVGFFDYVLSINSLYRIRDIRRALLKMQYLARDMVLVRTVHEPFLASFYASAQVAYNECCDHLLFPLVLHELGIHANVRYESYGLTRRYHSFDVIEQEIKKDISAQDFKEKGIEILTNISLQCSQDDGGVMVKANRKVAFVYSGGHHA